MQRHRPDDWFELSAGALCLDFANTVSERPTDRPRERLETYRDLLQWTVRAGVLTGADAKRRERQWRRRPQAASSALADAKRCREIVYRIFSDLAAGRDARAALETFTRELGRILPVTSLSRRGDVVTWCYAGAPDSPDAVLWPILWSAAELLASERRAQVRECEARDCGWLFLEESHGRRRRWCNMRVCGNREKVRRFRARA